MLTGTSFPTTALISNGIDRAERYCADTTPIWRCGTWRATTAVRPGPTGRPRTSKRSRISTPPTCRNAKRNWARTSTTSSTRSTRCSRRMPRILCVNMCRRGANSQVDRLTPDSSSKRRPDCRLRKPVTEFSRNAARPDGLQFYCKECYSLRAARAYRQRQLRNGRAVRERVKVPRGHKYCRRCDSIKPFAEWRKNARQSDGLSGYCKACRQELARLRHLKKTFGLTPESLAALIDGQGGTCAICQGPPQHIDHDHATGKVRGVLCGPCNMGLGQFADDPKRLMLAATYLRRHGMTSVPAIDEYSPAERVVFEIVTRHRSA